MDELKPIRTNTDHARAMREVDRLIALDPRPKSREADRLELLTILIDAFERTHPDHRIDTRADPVATIEFHLERLGKTPKDLEAVLGATRTRVWEILNRKRLLTLTQIRALVRELGIPADRLVTAYDLSGPPENNQEISKAQREAPGVRRVVAKRALKRKAVGAK